MRNFLIILTVAMSVAACGAKDPLSRGEYKPVPPIGGFGDKFPPVDEGFFNDVLVAQISKDCAGCHSDLINYNTATTKVIAGDYLNSVMYKKASGAVSHIGEAPWADGSAELIILKTWIMGNEGSGVQTRPEKPTPTNDSDAIDNEGSSLDKEFFEKNIHPNIKRDCTGCHSGLDNYEAAKSKVIADDFENSIMYRKTSGVDSHMGGAPWKEGSTELSALKSWIMGEKTSDDEFTLDKEFFDKIILPNVMRDCKGCHKHRDPETGYPVRTFEEAVEFVIQGNPEESRLYLNSVSNTNTRHPLPWVKGSDEATALVNWIMGATMSDGELSKEFFDDNILPNLNQDCAMCHDNFVKDYDTALHLVKPGNVDNSSLYKIVSGKGDHRAIWRDGTDKLNLLIKWIMNDIKDHR